MKRGNYESVWDDINNEGVEAYVFRVLFQELGNLGGRIFAGHYLVVVWS